MVQQGSSYRRLQQAGYLNTAIVLGVIAAETSTSGWYWFLWHPVLMTFACCIVLPETLRALSGHSLFNTFTSKILSHYWLVVITELLAFTGFYVIYINKNEHGKPHFTSYHAWIGILMIMSMPLQSLIGRKIAFIGDIVTKYVFPDSAKSTLRIVHKTYLGKLLLLMMGVSMLLGSMSNWAKRREEVFQYALLMGGWMYLLAVVYTVMTQ